MLSKKFYSMVAIALLFGACNKTHDVNVYVPDEGEIVLNMIHPEDVTRVSGAGFDTDDKIGVYLTASDASLQLAGNEVNNEAFVYRNNGWTSQRKVYWNEGSHNIYAYYPYSSNINDIMDYSFSVQTDQSTYEGYSQSDFLWASATDVVASSEPIDMVFEHKLSRVIVQLIKGEEFEGDIPANTEVYIDSTVPHAFVDLATGDTAKNSQMGQQLIRCRQLSNYRYAAIIVPQNITSKMPLVEVIIGDVSYLMYGKMSFRPGYSHTINVTLNHNPEKIKIEIGGESDSWN